MCRGNPEGSSGDRPKSKCADSDGGNKDDFGESLLMPLRREDDDDDEGIGGGGGIGGAPMEKSEEKNGDEPDDGGGGPKGGRRSGWLGLKKRLRSSLRANVGN